MNIYKVNYHDGVRWANITNYCLANSEEEIKEQLLNEWFTDIEIEIWEENICFPYIVPYTCEQW